MKAFFKDLFEYNRKRNVEMADLCALHETAVSEHATRLFSHNLNAHHIWNQRILRKEPRYGVWDLHIINSWDTIDHENFEISARIIKVTPLETVIHFEDSKGQSFRNSLRDILFHVINHTNYHRAQIVSELRYAGLEPEPTDYIFYKRKS